MAEFAGNISNSGDGVAAVPNGLIRWSSPLVLPSGSPVIGSDGTIYELTQVSNQDGTTSPYITAINPDGTMKGSVAIPGFSGDGSQYGSGGSSPVLAANGYIYVADFNGNVTSFVASSLKYVAQFEAWDVNVYESEGFTSSPTIGSDGTIYIGGETGLLYALNPDLSVKWMVQANDDLTSSPALSSNGSIICVDQSGEVYCYGTGGVLTWHYQTGMAALSASPCIGPDGTIYVSTISGVLYALQANGTLKWSSFAPKQISACAIGANGSVCFGCADSNVYSLNSDGTANWTFATKGSVLQSPIVGSDGSVYISSSDDNEYGLSSKGDLIWKTAMQSASPGPTAIGADGTLYLLAVQNGLNNGFLFAIGNPLSVVVRPSSILGGNSLSGTITLASPALSGGEVINLSTNNLAVTVPSTVTVAAGSETATFPVQTSAVSADVDVQISASYQSELASNILTVQTLKFASLLVSAFSAPSGANLTGAVSINGFAPDGGVSIALSSSSISGVVPSTVTIPAGARSALFTITNGTVSTITSVLITGTAANTTLYAGYAINPPALTTVSFNPSSLVGGTSSTGTVSVVGLAPAGGWPVNLSSNASFASVPSTITIPEGKITATFSVSTTAIAATNVATITATANSVTHSSQLTVYSPLLTNLLVNPSTIVAGSKTTGAVSISSAAPAGGMVVLLRSSSNAISYPTNVTIPAGGSRALFSISGNLVSADTDVTLYGSVPNNTLTAEVTVDALTVSAFRLNPTSVVGGGRASGAVSISGIAPAGGVTIKLTSNQSSAVPPASVTIPAGKQSALFYIDTTAVSSNKSATLTATLGSSTATASLTVQAPVLSSLRISPVTVVGGRSVTGAVSVSSPAPSGGLVISLSSSSNVASAPATVTIPAGATSVLFTIATTTVGSAQTVTISGSLNGLTKTGSLTLQS